MKCKEDLSVPDAFSRRNSDFHHVSLQESEQHTESKLVNTTSTPTSFVGGHMHWSKNSKNNRSYIFHGNLNRHTHGEPTYFSNPDFTTEDQIYTYYHNV